MNKIIIICLPLLFIFNSNAIAQDAFEEQRAELRQLLQVVEDAINNKDISTLQAHVRPNAVVIFQDAVVAVGYEQVNAYFERMVGASDSVVRQVSFKATVGAPAEFYSENLAVAFGDIDADFDLRAGKSFKLHTVWTTTVVNDSDNWSIASLHLSNNLFDNPILNASKSFAWILGAIGLVAGLVAGLLFMWLKKRSGNRPVQTPV